MATILAVDDEPRMLKVLSLNLTDAGHDVLVSESGEQALKLFEEVPVDLVLTDISMPGMTGVQLLAEIQRRNPSVPVVMLTAFGSVESVVEAMRAGAVDYLTKPVQSNDLVMRIQKALERRMLKLENQQLREEVSRHAGYGIMVGNSEPMQKLFAVSQRVAVSDTTVLILGESGTGKELVARTIHQQSPRADRAFVSVNCIAIPEDLLESEMFGHVRGAFTGADRTREGRFAAADGGTLFLDEIGDMSLALQGKLLRVLQEQMIEPVGSTRSKKVNVRILAATNKDLPAFIKQGLFREDLFHRLNVVPITVPPLRDHPDDIPLLVEHFLKKASLRIPEGFSVSADLMESLMRYEWPGNVRELENLVQRALVLGDPDLLRMTGSSIQFRDERPKTVIWKPEAGLSYKEAKAKVLDQFEREFFTQALVEHDGNISRTAETLGLHRKNLQEKLDRLGIRGKDLASA